MNEFEKQIATQLGDLVLKNISLSIEVEKLRREVEKLKANLDNSNK